MRSPKNYNIGTFFRTNLAQQLAHEIGKKSSSSYCDPSGYYDGRLPDELLVRGELPATPSAVCTALFDTQMKETAALLTWVQGRIDLKRQSAAGKPIRLRKDAGASSQGDLDVPPDRSHMHPGMEVEDYLSPRP